MKNLLTTAAFAAMFFSLAAQDDYRLFRPGVQYLYDYPEADSNCSHDEPAIVGMKLSADSCAEAYTTARMTDFAEQIDIFGCLPVMGSFAGNRICHSGEETVLHFRLLSEAMAFRIRQGAVPGEVWEAAFDERPVYGTVSEVRRETFLGLSDSVKYLLFYTLSDDGAPQYIPAPARPVRISKQYGLLSGFWFRDNIFRFRHDHTFHLRGMSDPPVGMQNPGLSDFFNMNIGDEFHVEEQNALWTPIVQYRKSILRLAEYHLDAATQSLYLGFDAQTLSYRRLPAPAYTYYDTVFVPAGVFEQTFQLDQLDFLDAQPGALYLGPDPFDGVRPVHLTETQLCGLLSKRIGYPFLQEDSARLYLLLDAPDGDVYHTGAAGPYYNYFTFTGCSSRYLQYARRGEESCGNPFDFSSISSVRDSWASGSFSLFPNPAGGQFHLHALWNAPCDVIIQLFSAEGRLLVERRRAHTDVLREEFQGIEPGYYVVRVRGEGQSVALPVVVHR